MKFILGKKLGMTTIFGDDGKALNITLVECSPSKVTLVRSEEKEGYDAVQVEIEKTTKRKHKKEFRLNNEDEKPKKDEEIKVDIFQIGDKVKISGISKAKGFQGVVKRHGFSGSPKTHGHRHDLRAPGSIGSSFPEHVIKGKKMAGRMGGKRKSTLGLEIVLIDTEKNLIGLRGAVPGITGAVVEIASYSN